MRIAVRPRHRGDAGPAGAVLLDSGDDSARRFLVAERDQHLVQNDVVQDLELVAASPSANAVAWRQSRSMRSARPGAAERAQHGPNLHAARAARELGRMRSGLAHHAVGQVRGRHAHRGAQRLGVAHEGQPAVVGHVEPLVGRPRIGGADAAHQMGPLRRHRRPEAERAIDVSSRLRAPGRRSARWGRRRPCSHCRPARRRWSDPNRRHRVGAHPALTIGRHLLRPDDPLPPETQQAEALQQRLVYLVADDDGHRWRPEESLLLVHVPRGPRQYGVGAAASAVRLAIVPPVTKPATDVDGRPRSSTSQRCATCSSVAATGKR